MASIEVFIIMDSDGEAAIGTDEDEAWEQFDERIGSQTARRVVKLTVDMDPPPAVEEGPKVSVPASAGKVSATAS